jgi:hypothetical protein
MQAPAGPDERPPVAVIGTHEAILDIEPAAEGQGPRLLGDEGVGTGLDDKPVRGLGLDGAPEPVARLQERQLQREPALPRQLDRAVGRGQPADAAPDDELYRAPSRGGRAWR